MLKSPPQTTYTTSSSARTPLRRASYVTVDKLVNSQYVFDLNKFNAELHKIRTENEANSKAAVVVDPDSKASNANELTAVAAAGVASLNIHEKTNTDAKVTAPNAWSNPLSALPSTWQQQQQQQQSSQVLPPSNNSFKFPNQSHRLQPPRDGFNLCVLVGKVDVVVDKLRVDGSRVHVAEVQVGDNTGSISLRARDEQIDMLMQVSKDGGAVVLRNCTVELHQRKYLRLAVSKWGKMKAYPDGIASTPDPPLSMNEERNFSLVDLNLVATSKENILPNQSSASHQQPKFDPKLQDHRHHQHQGRGYHFDASRGPGYHQNHPNRKYQNRGRQQQQPSMYSPQRGYHQQQYYQPYTGGGDASSVYSYQSHSTEQSSHSSRGGQQQQQHWSHHHSPYQNEQYNPRQQQQHQQHQQLMYQQYELQQRHAHQMQMLQETQRRLMAVEQQRMGGHPQGVNMVESHDGSSEEYSVSSSIAMGPPMSRGSFPPPPPPMGYPYSSPPTVSSPMMNMLLPGVEQGGSQHHQDQQQSQQLGLHGTLNDATVVSPPNSPNIKVGGQGTHPVGYGDPLLYFDQSSIPLTGMQGSNHGEIDGQHDDNIQF